MTISFCLIFGLSMLEAVWWTVYDDDVVDYERSHGESKSTKVTKALIRERMVVVNLILFAIHLLTYFSPLFLGRLSQGKDHSIELVLVAYAVLLFFFGEVRSKSVGYKYTIQAALKSAVLITWVLRFPLFFPIIWVLKKLSGKERRLLCEADVIATAQAAREHGALHSEEASLIERMLEVGNSTVADFMIPLNQCVTVPFRPTRQQLAEAASKRSRIVICAADDPNTIIGVVTAKDIIPLLLSGKPEDKIDLTRKLRPTIDLPKTMLIPEAFRLLRKPSFGTVIDSGKMIGFITMRGILEKWAEVE